MKAKLIIDGKEFDVNLCDEIVEKILPKNKTGYERADHAKEYFCEAYGNKVVRYNEVGLPSDRDAYESANYYSDRTVAENNARADKLMRQLRRFAVEHREYEMNWENCQAIKYYIFYNYSSSQLLIEHYYSVRCFGGIYFRSRENAKLAIEAFKDELTWYFTEYKDSL